MKVHATVPSNGASFENYSESNITETMLHTRDTVRARLKSRYASSMEESSMSWSSR